MSRTDEEFKEEILRRSQRYIEKRRRMQKKLMLVGTSAAVFLMALVSFNQGIFMQHKEGIKQVSNDEDMQIQETTPEIIKDYGDMAAIEGQMSGSDYIERVTQNIGILLLDYNAEYTRIDGSGDLSDVLNESYVDSNDKGLLPVKADTLNELNAFVKEVKSSYEYVWDSINDITAKYDNEFFEENSLLLIYVGEGSGSIRHKVTSVTREENKLSVYIERLVPEAGTCDMAGWLITVELKKSDIEGCSEFMVH